jgi:hypothetical protein
MMLLSQRRVGLLLFKYDEYRDICELLPRIVLILSVLGGNFLHLFEIRRGAEHSACQSNL